MNRILQEKHGQRIAVIENEFGEAGIDNQLLIQEEGEQIVEMNNGCNPVAPCAVIWCGFSAISPIWRRANQLKFSRVIIETTGLADPAPVAQTFFVEDAIAAEYRLDAIITVVDAVHAMTQLDEHHEAQEQVGFADRILISKTDLVTEEGVTDLSARLRQMNPRAPITRVHFGEADIQQLLDIQAFDLESILAIEPDFMADLAHEHDDEITSFVYRDTRPFVMKKLQYLFGSLMDTYGKELLRFKGVLNVAGMPERILLQGMHMIIGDSAGAPWRAEEQRESTLVFIGRNLPKDIFMRGFSLCHA